MDNGNRIAPEAWAHETTSNGDRSARNRGDFPDLLPRGCYRNKWYQPSKGYVCGIGIHGQWLVVDPASETVIVKMRPSP